MVLRHSIHYTYRFTLVLKVKISKSFLMCVFFLIPVWLPTLYLNFSRIEKDIAIEFSLIIFSQHQNIKSFICHKTSFCYGPGFSHSFPGSSLCPWDLRASRYRERLKTQSQSLIFSLVERFDYFQLNKNFGFTLLYSSSNYLSECFSEAFNLTQTCEKVEREIKGARLF